MIVKVNASSSVAAVGAAESVAVTVTLATPSVVGRAGDRAVRGHRRSRRAEPAGAPGVRRGAAGRGEVERGDRHADLAGLVAGVGGGQRRGPAAMETAMLSMPTSSSLPPALVVMTRT